MKNTKPARSKARSAKGEAPHVTHGNVFEALGFSPEEALSLKIKTDCHSALMALVERHQYTQRDLQKILDQPQPRISELLNGKISMLSIEKLIEYLERLGAKPQLAVKIKGVPRIKASTHLQEAS
jgi:predicted XRE-type DNA-binding protein